MSDFLKVVELDPHCKPHVDSMTQGLEGVCEQYIEQGHVTLAEVVGSLEIIKHEYIKRALEESDEDA